MRVSLRARGGRVPRALVGLPLGVHGVWITNSVQAVQITMQTYKANTSLRATSGFTKLGTQYIHGKGRAGEGV